MGKNSISKLEAQFAASEKRIASGSGGGGYELNPNTLKPGKVKKAPVGKTQTEFAGKSKAKWEAEDEGWEFVDPQMDD